MSRQYPYQWVDIPDEEVKQVLRKPTRSYVRSVPGDVWMPATFKDVSEKIYNFDVRDDDIWIVTFPKCGTTWTQEMVWQIVNGVDAQTAREIPLPVRSPFLEFESMAPATAREALANMVDPPKEAVEIIKDSVNYTSKLKSPRIIKSHLHISMLPPEIFTKKCKIIYVCRNPKDACVSFFHHNQLLRDEYAEDFEHFQQLFMNGTFVFGGYWSHLKDAWKYKGHPNLRIVWFEEMKKDLKKVIRETLEFTGYSLSEEKINELDDVLHIRNLRQNGFLPDKSEKGKEISAKFFRKGEVGDWKNYFEGENLKVWDEWINENLQGTDIKISFE